jgi:hypothetical protein
VQASQCANSAPWTISGPARHCRGPHRGAYLLRRAHEVGTEFVALTLFDSLDDIRRFAGPAVDAASVSPAARAMLDDADERVRHYTVVSAPTPP